MTTKDKAVMNGWKRLVLRISMFAIAVPVIFGAVESVSARTFIRLDGPTPFSINRRRSVTRKLRNISSVAGKIHLKMNWYTRTMVPGQFSKLKIELFHGSTRIDSRYCYPLVSRGKSPLCSYTIDVSRREAIRKLDWKLKISNYDRYDVYGFDIRKGNDRNPLVSNFYSHFEANRQFRALYGLRLEGAPHNIPARRSLNKRIYLHNSQGTRIGTGRLELKGKWHVDNVIPTFARLRIELLKPNGQVARSGSYYSYHAPGKSPRFDFNYTLSRSDSNLSGDWKLRIINQSSHRITGFDIRKGSERSPLVPSFQSWYRVNP